jgi:thioredoxin 2
MEIVCTHCLAINRVSAERLADSPICGKCKQALLPAAPVTLSDTGFASVIARTALPVLVDFWAPWCNPCLAMAPMYAEAAQQLQGRILLGKLDTEANPATAAHYGIRSIPTLVLFRNGQEIAREAGARPTAEIIRWLERHLD